MDVNRPTPTDHGQLAIALRELARDLDRMQSDDWHEISQDAVRVLWRLSTLCQERADVGRHTMIRAYSP
jgi:hypothetical protein